MLRHLQRVIAEKMIKDAMDIEDDILTEFQEIERKVDALAKQADDSQRHRS